MRRLREHIDRHLDGDAEFATLAAVANFSPLHFQRVFSARVPLCRRRQRGQG